MSTILKFDLKTNKTKKNKNKKQNKTFFRRKLSKVHKKDKILHVTITFSLNKGNQEQAVDPFVTP